jgi:hypothetical protein
VSSHPSRPAVRRTLRGAAAGSGPLSALRPTWSSAGSVVAPAWPCTGWGLPGRRVAATPVRSYRTISPLPAPGYKLPCAAGLAGCFGPREARHLGGVFLWHFPAGFPGSVPRPPCPAVSGLSSRGRLSLRPPRGCLAGSTSMVGGNPPHVDRACVDPTDTRVDGRASRQRAWRGRRARSMPEAPASTAGRARRGAGRPTEHERNRGRDH